MNKVFKLATLVGIAALCALFFGKKMISGGSHPTGENVLSILKKDLRFSKNRLSYSPGEKVSLRLFNGLTDQDVIFYILKEGEDPTLVQHLKAQQGELSEDYFYYKAEKVSPKSEVVIDFTAPDKEGDYYYVGIGDLPMETLYGKISIQDIQTTEVR